MICRRCLQRASALARQTILLRRTSNRPFSTTPATGNAAAAAKPAPAAPTPPPKFGTPLGDAGAGEAEGTPRVALSSCPAGTVLTGLNYFKNRKDPVALPDEQYPAWLWRCLDVTARHEVEGSDDAEAEFSKSKKQRRIAAKRQRQVEAQLLAKGNIEALAPKIPLQQQTINLPSNDKGTVAGASETAVAREDLRKAMRKVRKQGIKEANYLKTM